MCLKVFASDLSQLLFILKWAMFLQPLEVLYLHKVYYVKLSLIIFIYYVPFTDLILEKGFMKVENVRILRCFTIIKVADWFYPEIGGNVDMLLLTTITE